MRLSAAESRLGLAVFQHQLTRFATIPACGQRREVGPDAGVASPTKGSLIPPCRTPPSCYIDPYKRRGRLYRAVRRVSATKAGTWLSVNIAWKVDPHLLKPTRVVSAPRRRLPQHCSKREARGRDGPAGMPRSTSTTAIG